MMLDPGEKEAIRKDLDALSRGRIEVMKQGREVVKASKELIYSLHRGEMGSAGECLVRITEARRRLDRLANTPRLRAYHPYQNAVQEHVEAAAYHSVVAKGRIPRRAALRADTETYLGGLSDLTGELARKGVDDMIHERYAHASLMKDVVEEIYGLILSLDFDGGEARRKSDAVKWNLAKLEDLVYDAKIRGKV